MAAARPERAQRLGQQQQLLPRQEESEGDGVLQPSSSPAPRSPLGCAASVTEREADHWENSLPIARREEAGLTLHRPSFAQMKEMTRNTVLLRGAGISKGREREKSPPVSRVFQGTKRGRARDRACGRREVQTSGASARAQELWVVTAPRQINNPLHLVFGPPGSRLPPPMSAPLRSTAQPAVAGHMATRAGLGWLLEGGTPVILFPAVAVCPAPASHSPGLPTPELPKPWPMGVTGSVAHTPKYILAAAIVAFRVSPSTPRECLSQIRSKKRTWDDMFNELLQANVASDSQHRAWRMNIEGNLEKERVERRKVWESQQEKEREMHQDIMSLVRRKTQMLQILVHPQVQQSWACLPLQPIENSILGPTYTPLILHGIRGHCTTPTTPPCGTLKTITASHTLTCESQSWCMCS